MNLRGKTVMVTGASSGIGHALSESLSIEGSKLLLTSLEENELGAFTEELRVNYSADVDMMASDLSDYESRNRFIEWVKGRPEPPDILVNNAGAGLFGRFEQSSWVEIEKQLTLNIHAVTHLTYELIPLLKLRPEAKIVNISSAVSRLPYPGLAVYGAAKGYISSLSESLACELADTGVSVLCFHPGFTMTGFMGSAGMDMSRIPKAVVATPERVAAQIIRAIKQDKQWGYSDLGTRLGVFLSSLIPARIRTTIFKNLFWRLPDE
jgi:short-subunit dehydrogenase